MCPKIFPHPASLYRRVELQQLVTTCQDAASQWEQSQSALLAELCRLSEELETKNHELTSKNRLAALGQIAAHIAHEVHENLVPVSLYLRLLRRRLSDDSGSLDILGKIEADLSTLDDSLGELLNFTADCRPNLQAINLRQVVDDVCESLAESLANRPIEIVADVPRHLTLLADRKMLRCAILNLARNAMDAMPQGGRLVLTSYLGADGVELEVADSGPGLTEEVRRHVFEPFFTTKGDGAGLGLATVCRIVEVHGGNVMATNCPEGGAAFTLRFPQRSRAAAA